MSTAPDTAATKLPPMLTQYLEYKSKYPDAMLFFQVGDFYELFFDDAVTVARTLNLTLTSRDKTSANPIPMCGVPQAVVDGYIDRLVARGFSAAVVSQVEPADGVAQKGMFARKLDRIVTPGVRLLGNGVPEDAVPVVAALGFEASGEMAIAFSDVQSGTISVREGVAHRTLRDEFARVSASEVILPMEVEGKRLDRRLSWVKHLEEMVGPHALKFRVEGHSVTSLTEQRTLQAVKGYAALSGAAKHAVKLLVQFIDETTVERTIPIAAIEVRSYSGVMVIDSMTRSNLELVRNIRDGSRAGSLLGVIDRTLTLAGARLLRNWVTQPLTTPVRIAERLDAVGLLKRESLVRSDLRALLRYITDLERIAARLELLIASPRELGALREAFEQVPQLAALLRQTGDAPALLESIVSRLAVPEALAALLARALVDKPPPTLSDGGVIRDGYDADLDRLREVKRDGHSWIVELETRERERTGISTLKVKYNNVIGYFIEVSKANLAKVPDDFIRRQNTVSGDRFTTPELQRLEREVLGAEGKELSLEKRLFEHLKLEARQFVSEIRQLSHAIAELDVVASLAELADLEGLVPPTIDESGDIEIEEGRHPVVASLIGGNFTPNDLMLERSKRSCMIVTGPNMGGKSTFLRQAALTVIMAQMGSYVFAKRARIGVVDRVYARLGASDNLAEGDSTFMVEMREAAHILGTASEHSLVLIDEIGRGTATMDGMSIARAVLECLVTTIRCRTLFATHFHELTELAGLYPPIGNLSVASEESEDGVVFTHRIQEGPANRSYGLEVATLAGLPDEVLDRAREVLKALEQSEQARGGRAVQLSMFSSPAPRPAAPPRDYERTKQLAARVAALDVNSMTPLDALNALASLVSEAREARKS